MDNHDPNAYAESFEARLTYVQVLADRIRRLKRFNYLLVGIALFEGSIILFLTCFSR